MILLIDNYDSFTYNLYQLLRELGAAVRVERNDSVDAAAVRRLRPSRVVLSPGPGRPENAGALLEIVSGLPERTPLLGVCLGHQALAAAYGGRVEAAPKLVHGKASLIRHDGKGLFRGLPNPMTAARYHSLAVREKSLPNELVVTARSEDGIVMGLRHRRRPVFGVQFHPESILTPDGRRLLANFLGKSS